MVEDDYGFLYPLDTGAEACDGEDCSLEPLVCTCNAQANEDEPLIHAEDCPLAHPEEALVVVGN